MTFTNPEEIKAGYDVAVRSLRDLQEDLVARWLPSLKSPRAKEYLAHGVCRRMSILLRCVENVFTICPVDRTDLLSRDELADLQINLHAFVINVHGLLDNLAWVIVFEKAPDGFTSRRKVWLFSPKLRPHLPPAAQTYLSKPEIEQWFVRYAQNYRDALAHRIPLYVPPSGLDEAAAAKYAELDTRIGEKLKVRDVEAVGVLLDEQSRLGTMLPMFRHSYGDEDASKPVFFHPQLEVDVNTLLEIVRAVASTPAPT